MKVQEHYVKWRRVGFIMFKAHGAETKTMEDGHALTA